MNLSPDASLLHITQSVLLKLATLRLSTADMLFIEQFGLLVWKDPVIVPIGKAKLSATLGGMKVIPATKDLWARKNFLTALMNAVNGLCVAIDNLLHPTIISTDRV